MGRAFNLASLLNGSGLVSLTSKVTGSLPNDNIAAMAASKLTGQVPDANAPSGSVIQVVSSTTSTRITTTSTAYVDTGLSVTITPTSASSKILVIATFSIGNGNPNYASFANLVRNSTQIAQRTAYQGGTSNTIYSALTGGMTILDEPATTSSTTYKIQYRADAGQASFSGPVDQGYGSGTATNQSSITVMEISG